MIITSAPAKVILFGEHAVVYGQPAIAVPVSSLRAAVILDPAKRPLREIHLVAADLLRNSTVQPAEVTQALEYAVEVALRALNLPDIGAIIRVNSHIPVASGLGSGAAVAAALIKAVGMGADRPFDQEVLNQLVYELEKQHHGTPSGIDNTVVVYEKPVYFVRDVAIETVPITAPFSLLIADSGVSAPTKIAVGDVRKLYESDQARVQPILESIGQIARQARQAIEAGNTAALGVLMTQNHQLLQALRVSSPELDRLVEAALSAGAAGAKLSGAGRGGNMISLVDAENQECVREALLAAGAVRVIVTTVGAS